MICSACRQDNDAGFQQCSRCGADLVRDVPPLLVLESLLTREVIWGLNIAGLVLPLGSLAGGFLGAWVIWSSLGFSGYPAIVGFVLMAPGAIFTLSLLPLFRRVRSVFFGLDAFAMFGLIAAAIGGLVLALYLFNTSFG